MSSAADILAAHQYRPDGRLFGTRCTHIDCEWFVGAGTSFADMQASYAAHVLAELAAAGHTVTLPQVPNLTVAETEDEHGRREWVSPIGEVLVFDDGEVQLYLSRSDPSPADLRSFADALYSAAAAAEAGEAS